MAVAESKLLALLSLVGALFLLSNALPFDHRGPGAALADLLIAELDRLQGINLIDLATRRNMVLLCHAILLVVLRDAGLLGTTQARRRRSASAAAITTSDIFVAACYPPTERSLARSAAVEKEAAVDDIGRLERQRRGAWRAVTVEDPCAAPSLATDQPDQGAANHQESTKEQRTYYIDDHHHLVLVAGEPDQPAAMDCKTIPSPSTLDFGAIVVVADGERNRAQEDDTAEERELPHEYGQQEDEDLDDMNRRFEAFIADTKKKMRLEETDDCSLRTESINVQTKCPSNRSS